MKRFLNMFLILLLILTFSSFVTAMSENDDQLCLAGHKVKAIYLVRNGKMKEISCAIRCLFCMGYFSKCKG